ncbi:MAG TPA: hypothetical protein VKR53_12610 [Puia sp.]|nr:hypothetical protein [Puia sp.]
MYRFDGKHFGLFLQTSFPAGSYSNILKITRTIADMAGSGQTECQHVAEAVHFSCIDKQMGADTKITKLVSAKKILNITAIYMCNF